MNEKSLAAQGQTRRITWSDIHERLERAAQLLNTGGTHTDKEKVLEERAKVLGRVAAETVTETLEVLEFFLAHERYAIETSYVREVYPLKALTPVPCTPAFVLGIINVRSQILSIIDLKKFFDLPERGVTDLNKVIIVHKDKMEFGILADAILGVRRIAAAEIQPSLHLFSGAQAEYLRGVTRERLVVLAAEKLFSAKDLVVHEEI
jgi:purine-binding chemotaxis protein CheW